MNTMRWVTLSEAVNTAKLLLNRDIDLIDYCDAFVHPNGFIYGNRLSDKKPWQIRTYAYIDHKIPEFARIIQNESFPNFLFIVEDCNTHLTCYFQIRPDYDEFRDRATTDENFKWYPYERKDE